MKKQSLPKTVKEQYLVKYDRFMDGFWKCSLEETVWIDTPLRMEKNNHAAAEGAVIQKYGLRRLDIRSVGYC